MTMQSGLTEKINSVYKMHVSRVVNNLIPGNPTLLIIRAALGTILMFLVVIGYEMAGVWGLVSVCILFIVGFSIPIWLMRRKMPYTHKR